VVDPFQGGSKAPLSSLRESFTKCSRAGRGRDTRVNWVPLSGSPQGETGRDEFVDDLIIGNKYRSGKAGGGLSPEELLTIS
jgi:hypothetical protein